MIGRATAAFLAAMLGAGSSGEAAVAPCGRSAPSELATRIATVACEEHRLWHSPFIDIRGRLAHIRVSEGEAARLSDRATPAWQRVVHYWRGSGLRWPPRYEGAADCDAPGDRIAAASCRAFLIDTPWSSVFVSYVMSAAGAPDFEPTARHVDYVRAAYRGRGPYRFADPDAAPPAAGDLLCFGRVAGTVFGHEGMKAWLERSGGQALNMHCDVVVAVSDGKARLVGGNVLQGVTMRELAINRAGRFWSLPRRTASDDACSPDNERACNLNQQDWVALLKLDPGAVALHATAVTPQPPEAAGQCCEVCTLPMPEGMRRCPAPSAGEGTD